MAIVIFFLFVGFTMALSFYLGGRAKSSQGYFAAHGQIPWFVNGVAFAGDYLSAASFLGICGMIAFYGYDGFLYSIGFLAGWIVALFVVAEPMKRLGKFTFADALDARFQSKGIKLAAGISTLVVSIFYLIPQMVGAGALIKPLFSTPTFEFPQWLGVVLVGATVTIIVVTAGMVSTTWVQFLKGSLLVIFSAVLTFMILGRGFTTTEDNTEAGFKTLGPISTSELSAGSVVDGQTILAPDGGWEKFDGKEHDGKKSVHFVRTTENVWSVHSAGDGQWLLREAQVGDGEVRSVGHVSRLPDDKQDTGSLGFLSFFSTLQESEVVLWRKTVVANVDGSEVKVFYQQPTQGKDVLRPGTHPKFSGIRSEKALDKLNFLSLMLALFCGTASLPHILIRYYTVKDGASARKSTIVGIAAIGFFYILTLYIGLGAMTSGALDPDNSNMAAPLLAKSMAAWLFAVISAIAFTTVLGTVSGLILASAGAVTHDLLGSVMGLEMDDSEKVRVAKIASVVVGVIAIILGILFQGMNVGYLVGWAFSIAASANLPALIMLLFWKGVTKEGVISAVVVGMVSSLGWILLSGDVFKNVYGIPNAAGFVPFDQPGIVTIPLGFLTLIVVSLMTQPKDVKTAT